MHNNLQNWRKKETKAKIKLIKLDLYCAKSYFLFNLAYFPLMEPLAIRRMEALKITDCPRMTLVVWWRYKAEPKQIVNDLLSDLTHYSTIELITVYSYDLYFLTIQIVNSNFLLRNKHHIFRKKIGYLQKKCIFAVYIVYSIKLQIQTNGYSTSQA